MDETKPKRPWWKKKRTWAAAVWLASPVLYFLSIAPVEYCFPRGRTSRAAEKCINAFYAPLNYLFDRPPLDRTPLRQWWRSLGDAGWEARRGPG